MRGRERDGWIVALLVKKERVGRLDGGAAGWERAGRLDSDAAGKESESGTAGWWGCWLGGSGTAG